MDQIPPYRDQMQCSWSEDIEALARAEVERARLQVKNDLFTFGALCYGSFPKRSHESQSKRKRAITDSGDGHDALWMSHCPKLKCKDDGIEFGKQLPILGDSEW